MARVGRDELSRWHCMAAQKVLLALADYAKKDPTFVPLKNRATERWHATVGGLEYELLLTGEKFFDTRQQRGGGGAVDLAMHLLRTDFRGATTLLRVKALA